MKIMFVCTDNFTRSITAEMCLLHYLNSNNVQSIVCGSSGTHANSNISRLLSEHFVRMAELGIDTSGFRRQQFQREFFSEYDAIIAMAKEHQDDVQTSVGRRIPLFNQICKGEETSVWIDGADEKEIRAEL